MADEPRWEDLFSSQPDATPARSLPSAADPVASPTSRRELRESEGRRRGGAPVPARNRPAKPRRRVLRGFIVAFGVIALLAGIGGGAFAWAWVNYEPQVRKVLGWELPTDYAGTGNGEEVQVTIVAGDIGEDVAKKLAEAGVTLTFKGFYNLLLTQDPQVNFTPGTYTLQKEMSSTSALEVLANPENRVVSSVVIPEGATLPQVLKRLAKGTGIPLDELKAAAKDREALGLPAKAPSAEGFLFPATYSFDPGVTAPQVLKVMADRMDQALADAGVADKDRLKVLTMAALIQKEGGSTKDFYKVSRVFTNRLDQGMLLQSDATVSYGSGGTSILTTDAERADASNPYNTYVHKGLPVGPISAPGDAAIDAALNPAKGTWLYFVLVNGDTGETKFSTTLAQHDAAVLEWQAWYRAHPDFDN